MSLIRARTSGWVVTATILIPFAFTGRVRADCTSAEYGWTRVIASSGSESPYALATDATGHIYVAGSFQGTVDFNDGDGIDERTSEGSADIFLTKYGPDGSYEWTLTWGSRFFDEATSLAVDSTGSIVISGSFQLRVDFDPGEAEDIHNAGSDFNSSSFVTKLNPDLSYGWTTVIPGGRETSTQPTALSVDNVGNIVVVLYQRSVDQTLIVKLSPNGTPIWTGSTGARSGSRVATDQDGNVYLTGSISQTREVDLDPTDNGLDLYTPIEGRSDAFITKVAADGSYLWTRLIAGPLDEMGTGIAVASPDIVYVCLRWANGKPGYELDFDPGQGENVHVSHGGVDVAVLALDASGEYVWARTFGGPGSDYPTAITVDEWRNPIVIGAFGNDEPPESLVDFDPSGGVDIHSTYGKSDVFLTKLYSYSWYAWTRTLGSAANDEGRAVAVDSLGNVLIAGVFGDSQESGFECDFDPTEGVDVRTSMGSVDAFTTKLIAEPIHPTILVSNPPSGSIDARQDLSISGTTVQGIDRVRLTFSCRVRDVGSEGMPSATSFDLVDTAGSPSAVLEVQPIEGQPNTYDVVFADPIVPGEWTSLISYAESLDGAPMADDPGDRIDIGFLPCDVTGDGLSSPGSDILGLIDSINGVEGRIRSAYATDINRSGVTTGSDILRLIDLFNGVNTSRSWIAATLPDRP